MEVGFAEIVVAGIADVMTCVSVLPDWEAGMKFVGESAFDEANASFERGVLWSKEEMHVIGHNDKGVKFVTAFVAISLESRDEEFGVRGDLKESAAIVGCGGDEVRAGGFVVGGNGH